MPGVSSLYKSGPFEMSTLSHNDMLYGRIVNVTS